MLILEILQHLKCVLTPKAVVAAVPLRSPLVE